MSERSLPTGVRFQGVVWDFDGTLADTLPVALEVYNELAAERGFVPIDDPHAVRNLTISQFMKQHHVPAHRLPLTFVRFLREIHRRGDRIGLHPGIFETVKRLAETGIVQAVVSSNRTKNIEIVLERNQVLNCFQVITGTSRLFGKERRITSALKQLNIPNDRAVYVGDEIRDIEAARAAETAVAAVTWGMNSEEALVENSPDIVVSEADQLLTFILNSVADSEEDTCT
ncbi:MAG TPA: hypothetical protein DCG12_00320 [Planctomycetaceae bacterium]|nr:hypothetical protein [Planctomycetaceae bacterium]